MKKRERISERRMVEWEKAARVFFDGSPKRHLISCLFLLAFIFLFVGSVYPGSDEALFFDEENNIKLHKGEWVNEFSNEVTFEGNSDRAVPTEKAVKTYIDTKDESIRTHIEDRLQQYLKKDGEIVGNHLKFEQCGGRYACTPRACLARCIELKMRMATYSEVYAWASGGRDHCAYMWMLHPPTKHGLVRTYPMYSNTTKSGCGPINTGILPRMVSPENSYSWNESKVKADCACSSLK
jgi:hypothetical protein